MTSHNVSLLLQVFMCQLEGSKHWRLYGPREEGERLPRFSSPNFDQDEVSCLIIGFFYPDVIIIVAGG